MMVGSSCTDDTTIMVVAMIMLANIEVEVIYTSQSAAGSSRVIHSSVDTS